VLCARWRSAARKIFPFASICAKISRLYENADELRVSTASDFLSARAVSAAAGARRAHASARNVPARTPPHRQKKLCTGGLCGRIDGLGGAQTVRISANRFAPTGCSPFVFGGA
jgi:hypothetical protein